MSSELITPHVPAAATLPAEATTTAEASEHLIKRLFNRKNDFITSLSSTDFYIEIFFIGMAIVLARLAAAYLQHRMQKRFQKNPPRFIDIEFITKPLSLLTPVLALLFLTIDKIISLMLDIGSGWLDAVTQLCLAYIFARIVLMAVKSRPVAYFIAGVIMLVAVMRALRVMRSISAYLESISFDIGKYHISLLNSLHGFVIFVVVFWLASVLSNTLESYLRRSSTMSYNARELTVKAFKIFFYFIAFVITLSAIGIDLTAFAVFGGALGVGVGLGLQKLTGNFVSSVTLLMEKSVKIGDMIEVGGYTGWVRQLNMRYVLLETFDGREIMIPNEVLVSSNLTNWTHTTTKASIEIKVSVDYESDPVKAHELMLEAARKNPNCMPDPEPSCYMREFGDNGILFVLTFWISDVKKGRNKPQSEVMFAILEKFRAAGIKVARAP